MEIWSIYLKIWYWAYLFSVPIIIFSVGKKAPTWLKSGRLLFSIVLLPILTIPTNYARMQTTQNFGGHDYNCWIYDLYAFLLVAGISVIYTGWWELAWRFLHKQVCGTIKNDLTHNTASNIVIFISGFITLNFALITLGYKHSADLAFDVFWAIKGFVYLEIIPLAC
ncbi:hypothetical protein [Micavibrio aeruginosavorus]|uniref:hypothetical protein n=1 Tax=Micavibrio aeruginosavorus TaxID=349221 RepID=UPI003F4A90EC